VTDVDSSDNRDGELIPIRYSLQINVMVNW